MCWGFGGYGRLGNDGTANKDHPVHVVDGDGSTDHLSGVVQISAGGHTTPVLLIQMERFCVGEMGQVGDWAMMRGR